MSNFQHTLQQLFRKESLDEVSVEQLEVISKEFPLFAPAHFLLAKKYKQNGNDLYKKQLQKTALHFHNPLWLHYHLIQKEEQEPDLKSTYPLNALPSQEPPAASHDLIEQVVVNQELVPTANENFSQQPDTNHSSPEETPTFKVNQADDAHIGEMYQTNAESEARKLAETDEAAGKREENDSLSDDQNIAFPINEEAAKAEAIAVPAPAHHPIFSKIPEDENGDTKPAFEPFHTVDYFASQGIKINPEGRSEDKLGKQLKSFTEWLKTMRKLPEASVEAELEKINDMEVASFAQHSLEEKEVVTEAMAEVLFKQGRLDQAADVYRKLSLLNPGKSSYFAAKIEALKNH